MSDRVDNPLGVVSSSLGPLPPMFDRTEVYEPQQLSGRKRSRWQPESAPTESTPESGKAAPEESTPKSGEAAPADQPPKPKRQKSSHYEVFQRVLVRLCTGKGNSELKELVKRYPLPASTDVTVTPGVTRFPNEDMVALLINALTEPVAPGLNSTEECVQRWTAAMQLLGGYKQNQKDQQKEQKKAASNAQRPKDDATSSKSPVSGGGAGGAVDNTPPSPPW